MMSTARRVDMRGMTLRRVATTCSIGVKSSLCRITLYGGSCVTRRSVSISMPGLVSMEGATLDARTLCKVGVPRNIISGPPHRFPRPKYRAQDGYATSVPLPDERQDLLEDLFGGAPVLVGDLVRARTRREGRRVVAHPARQADRALRAPSFEPVVWDLFRQLLVAAGGRERAPRARPADARA